MVAKQDAAIHVGVLGLVFFSQKQFLKAFMFGLPIAVLFFRICLADLRKKY
jgi:hypothetical protein